MKIAIPHCGLSPETNSGGETYEREILTNLAKLGVKSEIILADGKKYPDDFLEVHIHRLPIRKGLRWYVSNLVWPHFLEKVERTCGFDLLRVHSLRYCGPGTIWFNAQRRFKYPMVCHHHHVDPSILNLLIETKVVKYCDVLITGSNFSKQQISREFGLSGEKIRVVPYGVDEKFRPAAKDSGLLEKYGLGQEKVLLFLAALKKRKKVLFLLDVFEEIKKNYPESVKLMIAGSGPLLSRAKQYVEKKKLGRDVIFTGYIPEEEKVAHYNLADIFVFPSEMEGFGFSPAEAMACGKPVVTSSNGSLPEIVEHGKSGFCVENQVGLFVEKIVSLLRDDRTREFFGREASNHAQNFFRWPSAAKATLSIYEDVLEKFRHKRS